MSWFTKAASSSESLDKYAFAVQDLINWIKNKTTVSIPASIALALLMNGGDKKVAKEISQAGSVQEAKRVVQDLARETPQEQETNSWMQKDLSEEKGTSPDSSGSQLQKLDKSKPYKFQYSKQNPPPLPKQTAGPVNVAEWRDRVITQESAGNPLASSGMGARGVMQIMPATWAEITKNKLGRTLPFEKADDPYLNIQMGVAYFEWIQKTLRKMMGKEPTIEQILAAYNGGVGNMKKRGYDWKRMPLESVDYVERITGRKPYTAKSRNSVVSGKPVQKSVSSVSKSKPKPTFVAPKPTQKAPSKPIKAVKPNRNIRKK